MENRKSIEKINETKSRFFGKLSRISKPPAALIRKNERMQVMGIRNERGDVRKRNKHLPRDPKTPRLESDAKETNVHLRAKTFTRTAVLLSNGPKLEASQVSTEGAGEEYKVGTSDGVPPGNGKGQTLRCTTGRHLKTVIPNERSRSQESTQCKSPLIQN